MPWNVTGAGVSERSVLTYAPRRICISAEHVLPWAGTTPVSLFSLRQRVWECQRPRGEAWWPRGLTHTLLASLILSKSLELSGTF